MNYATDIKILLALISVTARMIDWQEFPCNGMLLMTRAGAAAAAARGTGTRPLLWTCTRVLIRIGVKVFIAVWTSMY